MCASFEGVFNCKKTCWRTSLTIRKLENKLKKSEKMFCNILAEKQKVRTFASLSRGKRTEEYDILKNIDEICFSTASKNFSKKTFENVW